MKSGKTPGKTGKNAWKVRKIPGKPGKSGKYLKSPEKTFTEKKNNPLPK